MYPDEIQLIMVSYFRPRDFNNCLGSIIANTPEPYHLSVIDNSAGGLDNELDRLDSITVYKNNKNLGKANGVMAHYKQIMAGKRSEFFICLDADVLLPPGWLSGLLAAASLVGNPALIAPLLTHEPEDNFKTQIVHGLTMHRKGEGSSHIGPGLYRNTRLAGPLLLIRRDFFEKVGGFRCPRLYGGDDGYLCSQAERLGLFCGIATDVVVRHLEQDVTPGYRRWKSQSVNKDGATTGYWDQPQNSNNND